MVFSTDLSGDADGVLTLDAVHSSFPERVVKVEDRAAELGLTPAQTHMFRRVQGLDRMHYDPATSLNDLILPAAQKTVSQTDPRRIRYLFYCQGFQGVPRTATDTAQELKELLGLERARAIALTQQNCSIPLSAIDIAGALVRADADPDATALIVTGDKPYHPAMHLVMNTCITGHGATACLVSRDGPGSVLRSFATVAKGEYSDGVGLTPEQRRESAIERPGLLLKVMEEAVRRAGCTLDDIQLVLPTNPNVTMWPDTIKDSALLDKFFTENVPRYSHCLSSDLLINYVTLCDEKRFEPGRPSMFVAIGIGMTFSALVFTPSSDTGVC